MKILFQNKQYKDNNSLDKTLMLKSVTDKWNKLHDTGKTRAIGRSNNGVRVDYNCDNSEKIKNAVHDLLDI